MHLKLIFLKTYAMCFTNIKINNKLHAKNPKNAFCVNLVKASNTATYLKKFLKIASLVPPGVVGVVGVDVDIVVVEGVLELVAGG